MSNVLFLDIDGVLNSTMYWWRNNPLPLGQAGAIDTNAVKHLNQIVEWANPTIILSSSWRGVHPDGYLKVQATLAERGFVGVLSGQTPWLDGQPRHREIAEWLWRAAGWKRFAVLDDDSDAWTDSAFFATHGVHAATNYLEGMDERHVTMICDWFGVGANS